MLPDQRRAAPDKKYGAPDGNHYPAYGNRLCKFLPASADRLRIPSGQLAHGLTRPNTFSKRGHSETASIAAPTFPPQFDRRPHRGGGDRSLSRPRPRCRQLSKKRREQKSGGFSTA